MDAWFSLNCICPPQCNQKFQRPRPLSAALSEKMDNALTSYAHPVCLFVCLFFIILLLSLTSVLKHFDRSKIWSRENNGGHAGHLVPPHEMKPEPLKVMVTSIVEKLGPLLL